MKTIAILLMLSSVVYADQVCTTDSYGHETCFERKAHDFNVRGASQRDVNAAGGLDPDNPGMTVVNQARRMDAARYAENDAKAACLQRGGHWNWFFGSCN